MTKYESLYDQVQKGKKKVQDILKDYSITSEKDGGWLVTWKAKTENHFDVPIAKTDSIDDAIMKIYYFDLKVECQPLLNFHSMKVFHI